MKTTVAAVAGALLLGLVTLGSTAHAASTCYQLPFGNPDLADGWGSTCCGRTNPHRGVDFAQATGTPIPAVADGVVRRNEYNGCLGNALVIEHGDGMFSGYAHMVGAGLPIGTTVKRGDIIGHVGNTGTCTTGPHLHLTMAPGVDGFKGGTTVDPYAYIQGHLTCGPPPCDRTVGEFTFSCDGPQAGQVCVSVDEPADPSSWADNHFCTVHELGMRWSVNGPLDGMVCTQVIESVGPAPQAWTDNFLCVPPQTPYALAYSAAGPIAGQNCVHWNETVAPSWEDNFVCFTPVSDFTNGGLTFSADGPVEGKTCVNVDEPSDPDTWSDNHFCSDTDIGLKWSSLDPIAGMKCTKVGEGAEAKAAEWDDNYLCVPPASPYTFTWSSAGPLDGQTCVRWFDHAETSATWWDNWMCFVKAAPPAPSGQGGAALT
ncbi:MAG: M23 family metallopeptidase, partial [Myxococcales bacterium]